MNRRDPKGPMYKNRIVGHGEEAPDQLLANPRNWRTHGDLQWNEVEKALETVGWVTRVIVNRRTGHVVDGHLRIQIAMRREEETVPVTYIDVSEKEERLILATLDPLSALAGSDVLVRDELIGDVMKEWPEETVDIAALFKQSTKRVSFDATTDRHNVIVECGSEQDQAELIERLTQEGLTCRATSRKA